MTEETLFAEALQLPPHERAAFLLKACPGNEALRQRVGALLAAYNPADSFLERPAEANGQTGAYEPDLKNGEAQHRPTVRPGTQIGPYRLLQQIGEGGMGVVFMAEQEHPVRRRVALKVIKPGLNTEQVVARFEAERQALAMMNHHNIAHDRLRDSVRPAADHGRIERRSVARLFCASQWHLLGRCCVSGR